MRVVHFLTGAAIIAVAAIFALCYWPQGHYHRTANVDSPEERRRMAVQTFAQNAAKEIRYQEEQDKISFKRYQMTAQDTLSPITAKIKAFREQKLQKLYPAIYSHMVAASAFHREFKRCQMLTVPLFSDTVKAYLVSTDSLLDPHQVIIQTQLVMVMNFEPLDSVDQETVIKSLTTKRNEQLQKVIDRMHAESKNHQ